VLVQATLVIFLIRYRHRPHQKARFIHGNTRVEMLWTIVPAIILGALTFSSGKVWTAIRYAPESRPANVKAAKILVIGQQFKWNIIYPGPDGEFGQYLIYPRPADPQWPDHKRHGGVNGPRDLPPDQVDFEINRYISIENPLGKVYDDPKGKDDDYEGALARVMEVPVNRPVDVYLTSKDVIHSFTLPNFRVKLDTVPGLMGVFTFTPTITSKQLEESTRATYSIDELQAILARDPTQRQWIMFIDPADPHANKDATGYRYAQPDPKRKNRLVSIIRDGGQLLYSPDAPEQDTLQRLKKIGVRQITDSKPGAFEIACQELCGQGHFMMQGQLVVLSQEEYTAKYETASARGNPNP
jgi:heme/copper-type cytochrome/quinol oxidase subunit 2